jgi:predicted amidohydrolase
MTMVAAIQMCSTHLVDENLKMAAAWIAEAASNQAKLIVLPEMFAMMGMHDSDKLKIQEPLGQGKIQSFLSEQAKQHQVWIVGGTIPIASENPQRIKAACLVFDDQGQMVTRYDKIHLFDASFSKTELYKESDTVEHGTQVGIVDTPFGKLGLAVCYDVRFPELFGILFHQSVDIIALPSAFTRITGKAHWEILLRNRAIENFCYMIGACQGGTHANGRTTYGHSMIVGPWGEILAEKQDENPGVIYAMVDLKRIKEVRESIPVKNHQRL